MDQIRKFRPGGWLLHDRGQIDVWIRDRKKRAAQNPLPLIAPIQEFKDMVHQDPALKLTIWAMFEEAELLKQKTPLGTLEVKDFDEFLTLLNQIMTQAPEYTVCATQDDPDNPCGLIGFPINALLDWPMATASGYAVFSNALVNQQLKRIYAYWSKFLVSADSSYVLTQDSYPDCTPPVIGWLHPDARQHMVDVACQAEGDKTQPFEHFFCCDPSQPRYGFVSWDHFFTREFNEGIRPVASPDDDDVIANACESGPLKVVPSEDYPGPVKVTDTFWLKNQPYSLHNMMDFDPLAIENFTEGSTVYQAFLSALSYHRWHSPVNGTIKKAFVVNGTYYLENRYTGFISDDPDTSGPNDSQPFLSAVATRAVIFIEADNPKIGLMCVIPTGMAEVSSCELSVVDGQRIRKGEELGMFHFGGSTHCLIFRPDVNLKFDFHNTAPSLEKATNIPVRSRIATVI